MSYKNNSDEFSSHYTKCAGLGFCACCNEVICSDNESNNSIETSNDNINENNKDIQSK